ncbi:MAG TPA: MlaD family protein [Kofleriaceae bacterium]|nr:MlaD family protein [Kofleriaceae bacterium]
MPATRRIAWSALLVLTACGGPAPGPDTTSAAPPAPRDRRAAPAPAAASQTARFWAWLSDPTGLEVGAAVRIAGLPVGTIAAVRRGRHGTRIELAVPAIHVVWSNAKLWKSPTGRENEFYLTLDPGEGPTADQRGSRFAPRPLGDGEEIADVIEEMSAADLMDRIDRTLPGR